MDDAYELLKELEREVKELKEEVKKEGKQKTLLDFMNKGNKKNKISKEDEEILKLIEELEREIKRNMPQGVEEEVVKEVIHKEDKIIVKDNKGNSMVFYKAKALKGKLIPQKEKKGHRDETPRLSRIRYWKLGQQYKHKAEEWSKKIRKKIELMTLSYTPTIRAFAHRIATFLSELEKQDNFVLQIDMIARELWSKDYKKENKERALNVAKYIYNKLIHGRTYFMVSGYYYLPVKKAILPRLMEELGAQYELSTYKYNKNGKVDYKMVIRVYPIEKVNEPTIIDDPEFYYLATLYLSALFLVLYKYARNLATLEKFLQRSFKEDNMKAIGKVATFVLRVVYQKVASVRRVRMESKLREGPFTYARIYETIRDAVLIADDIHREIVYEDTKYSVSVFDDIDEVVERSGDDELLKIAIRERKPGVAIMLFAKVMRDRKLFWALRVAKAFGPRVGVAFVLKEFIDLLSEASLVKLARELFGVYVPSEVNHVNLVVWYKKVQIFEKMAHVFLMKYKAIKTLLYRSLRALYVLRYRSRFGWLPW